MARLVKVEMHSVNPVGDTAIWSITLEGPQTPPDPQVEANTLAGPLASMITTHLVEEYSELHTWDRVVTRPFESTTGTPALGGEVGLAVANTGTTTNLPPDCAFVVSLRTATSGARGRGRFYLPAPLANNATDDGLVLESFIDSVEAYITAVLTAWEAAGYTPVVYSRTYKSFAPVIQLEFGNVWDTQRRRDNAIRETRRRVYI